MSAPGPSRSRTNGGDPPPSASSSASTRAGPSQAGPVASRPKRQRRQRPKKAKPSPEVRSAAATSSATTAGDEEGRAQGKRKRREERNGSAAGSSSDQDGASQDEEGVVRALATSKGKERASGARRRSSKRSRSSVEHEDADNVHEDAVGKPTTSRFFAAAPATASVVDPDADASDEEGEVDAALPTAPASSTQTSSGSPSLSALNLGLRTVASPSLHTSLSRQTSSSSVPSKPASPAKSRAPAAAQPKAPRVDPALRERAVRLKLVDDLAKEKREREDEVASLRAEMDKLKKEVGFKNSELTGGRDALDVVRHSLTCTICMELLHQPYLISPCGHTGCYSCLKSWFITPAPGPEDEMPLPPARQPKSCPSCRGPVNSAPTPVYLIKDLVHSIAPALRLLAGDDPALPLPPQAQEALVGAGGDIWEGLFGGREAGEGLPRAHFDEMDRVWRCPDCFGEVVMGECSGCGAVYDNSAFEDASEFDDLDDRDDDDSEPIGWIQHGGYVSGDDEDEDEDDSEMDGFIVDSGDDEDDVESSHEDDVLDDDRETRAQLLSMGATRRMIDRFDMRYSFDTGGISLRVPLDDGRFVSIVLEDLVRFDILPGDRDGSRWLVSTLDGLPPRNPYFRLWQKERRARETEQQTGYRGSARWLLDDNPYTDREALNGIQLDDDDDDDDIGVRPVRRGVWRVHDDEDEEDEDDNNEDDNDEDEDDNDNDDNDDDDLSQYGNEAAEDDSPRAIITDDELEIAREHIRRQVGLDGKDDDNEDDDDDEDEIAPRRRARRVVHIASDEDEEDDSEDGEDDIVTSRHFGSAVRRRHARARSSSASASRKEDHSVDSGSDGDPETRSPSLLDDDEDRDESDDELDGEERGSRWMDRAAFEGSASDDGGSEEEEGDY